MSGNNNEFYRPPYSSDSTIIPTTRTPPPPEDAPPNPVAVIFNAILQNNLRLIRSILNQTNYDLNNLRNKDGKTPLMAASSHNCPDVVSYLCSIGTMNVDLQDIEGETALYQAAAAGNAEIVEILIKSHAYVEIGNKENITPLIIAAYNGHADVCRVLIDIGYANVDFQDNSNKSALALAAYEGHHKTAEVLLARGANVNIKDGFGWTPLMLAAFAGRGEVCRLLLIHNADKNTMTNNGKTAIILAREGGYLAIANSIENFVPGVPPSRVPPFPRILPTRTPTLQTTNNNPPPQMNTPSRMNILPQMNTPPRTNLNNYQAYNRIGFEIPVLNSEDPNAAPRGFMMPLDHSASPKRRTIQPKNAERRRSQYLSLSGEALSNAPNRLITAPHVKHDMAPRKERTPWVIFSLIVTACFFNPCLSFFGKMNDASVRQAWREKVALCFIILCISGFMGFITFGFSTFACVKINPLYPEEIPVLYGPQVPGIKAHIIRGKLYNTGVYFSSGGHRPIAPLNDSDLDPIITPLFGRDISGFFPPDNRVSGCGMTPKDNGTICAQGLTDKKFHCHTSLASLKALQSLDMNLFVFYTWNNVTNGQRKMFVYNSNVYDITDYLELPASDQWLGDAKVTAWLTSLVGKDSTKDIVHDKRSKEIAKCFNYFLVGQIDGTTIGCFSTNSVLIIMIVVFTAITLIKFVSAIVFDWFLSWQLGKISSKPKKDDLTSHIILLVTCYSEGEHSIRTTLDSLAGTNYSDKHKLLFVISDGDITGSENDRSTPQICEDLMEPFNPNEPKPVPKSYFAIGDGLKQHNMAKVVIGYYNVSNHRVPMVFINKVGTPKERKGSKAGNRGKRDSQLILMKWLSHICFNDRMSPLEFELFEKVRKLTGITPDKYEMVLMVDADTLVKPDSVGRMVAAMERDPKVMGLCGETKIANKTANWITMIQVFEYYISHHLGKSFESIFGGVTCLPGCFCMYRIKAPKYTGYSVPILVNPDIVEMYSSNSVETLHQKNLLLLGEDRYLTTLMLRTFTKRKMIYVPKAICKTVVPDEFQVLLSQRRRWINSTIHNLMELILVPQLCGIFCCSMQFVIFLELVGTVVLPSSLVFIIYLIYSGIQGASVILPLIFITATYFLQAFLVIFTSHKLIYVVWMLIFIIATPIWNFILPIYAFWHFDDFSWGATRKIAGEDNGHGGGNKDKFNRGDIPMKRWDEWKSDTLKTGNFNQNSTINHQQIPSSDESTLRTGPSPPPKTMSPGQNLPPQRVMTPGNGGRPLGPRTPGSLLK
ncbi:6077_t:CDS:2 [Diversispora eburnea]|uniref:chitin synthase n=1 Tax=Diversispora eburnea TaxID=1213867 RepID=A0A9N8YHY0_9GLOM|nr:6077_t:CDS:2 [Diversispora eburnea]